jgi:hypothetical protein
MEKRRIFIFLEILFIVLIAFTILVNPILTGNVILNINNTQFNLFTELIVLFLFGLILVFSLEKTLVKKDVGRDIEEGIYKGVHYIFQKVDGEKIALVISGICLGRKNRKIGEAIANELAKEGLSSIMYEVQKDEKIPTLGQMTRDTRLMNNLAKKKGFEKGAYSVIGHSLSGYIPLIAASNMKGVKEIVLVSPLTDFADMARKKGDKKTFESWREKGHERYGGLSFPWALYEQFERRALNSDKFKKIAERLKENSTEVGIIHGDRDTLIPLDYSEKLYDALKNSGVDVELDVLKGAKHIYKGSHFKKYIEHIGEYLSTRQKGARVKYI